MDLVTIATSTYNSSKHIIETLESFAQQTYPNIEVVIGDDASTDDTLEKVKLWLNLNNNRERFVDVKIIQVSENTGVSANANRSLRVASGKWIKFIGADDVLLPNCISDNMQFVKENFGVKVLFSKLKIYKDSFEEKNYLNTIPKEVGETSIVFNELTSENQYQLLLTSDRINFSPSVFLHKDTLLSVGGFDERFRLLEDYPLWLNLTKNGYKLSFMDKITVNYRRHAKAINNNGKKCVVNPNFFKQEEFRRVYIYPNLPKDIRLNQRFVWCVSQIYRLDWINKKSILSDLVYLFITVWINPFRYFLWVKKKTSFYAKNSMFYQ